MTYKLDEKQFELVKKYVTQCYEGKQPIVFDEENNAVTVADKDVFEFKDAADYAIIKFGMDLNQEHLTKLGYELQFLYDEIYYQEKHLQM